MRAAPILGSLGILIVLTGCALVPQRYRLTAEPLAQVTDIPPSVCPVSNGTVSPNCQFDEVNYLVQDSQTKCAQFVDSMFAETAGSGLALDVLSTGTSAVSAIVTPLSAAHALGATSSILGATKTGISANYLNTLSVSHITQAIQSTYAANIKNYIDSLSTTPKDQIDVFQERSKILSYHNMCSLAAAEGSISSTLQPPPQTAGQSLSITYKIGTAAGDNQPQGLATALAVAINQNVAFQQAGITAIPSGGAGFFLAMKSALTFSVTGSNSNFKPNVVQGSPNLPAQVTIAGTLNRGDTVTVSAAAATQQPVGAPTAPAGVSGARIP